MTDGSIQTRLPILTAVMFAIAGSLLAACATYDCCAHTHQPKPRSAERPGQTVIDVSAIENPFGMTFSGGLLWVQDPAGTVFLFDPTSGELVRQVRSDIGVGRDLVVVGDSFFQLDDGRHALHKYRKQDGQRLEQVAHPGTYPEGLASDGDFLYVVDIEGAGIQKRLISSPDYPIVEVFPPQSPAAHGMTWVDGYLYLAHNPGTVHKIDATTGKTVTVLDVPSEHANKNLSDIGFDGSRFWFLFNHDKKVVRAPAGWGV